MTFTDAGLAEARRRYEQTEESAVSIAAALGTSERTVQRLAADRGWVRHVPPPRDLTPAARLAAEARALAERAGGQGATLSPQISSSPPPERGRACPGLDPGSPSEARRVGVGAEALLTPTPGPSPQGGGEESAAPSAPSEEDGACEEDFAAAVDRLLRAVTRELAPLEALRAEMKNTPQRPRDAIATAQAFASLTETLNTLQRLRCGLAESSHDHPDDERPRDLDAFRLDLARRIDAFVASRLDARDAGGGDDPAG